MLLRRSGDYDKPRILTTFNEPIDDWLSFFMFTMFTDRDGKYQLLALAESGFDPRSRTTRFMLTEEAHHMFVGETGVGRIVRRACQLMKQDPNEDARAQGGIDLRTVQRFVNFWYSSSLDLFGGEISSNAADYFAAGLKGRAHEEKKFEDHVASRRLRDGTSRKRIDRDAGSSHAQRDERNTAGCLRGRQSEGRRSLESHLERGGVALRNPASQSSFQSQDGVALGTLLRCARATDQRGRVPSSPGRVAANAEDKSYLQSLMAEAVLEPGKMAHWIAPPMRGINGKPIDFEYIRRA